MLVVAGCVLLAGCGFHLRGSQQAHAFPPELAQLRVGSGNSPLELDLRSALREQANVTVVEAGTSGIPQLVITAQLNESLPWALDRAGVTSGALVSYRIRYSLFGPKNEKWINQASVRIQRDLAADKYNPLGVERQAEFLQREMRRDAVQQIVRRLAQFRPPAADKATSEPAPETDSDTDTRNGATDAAPR